jgi:hypothetical protein
MNKLEITKVVLSKEDIITCITNELLRQGLKPTKDINISVGSRLIGFGMGERPETYIQDTTIECEKV